MTEFSFRSFEKLKSRQVITGLFESGKHISVFPLRMVWQSDHSQSPQVKAGVSVSKRNFKKATDRNLLKRRLREAYRLNKKELLEYCKTNDISVNMMIIFTGKENSDYKTIETALKAGLIKLIKALPDKNISK
jgi:ribonuclease P protein component